MAKSAASWRAHWSSAAWRKCARSTCAPPADPGLLARAQRDGVRLCATAADAVAGVHLVVSAVTASQTRAAAASVVPALPRGAYLLDVNSASPRTKAACGALVAAGGGRYVESAVMTSVPPHGIRVPMLLGGPDAAALAPTLTALGFAADVASDTFGVASAIKMCRSVIIKGMEALALESFVAARRYGVEDAVLASLVETFPGLDWPRQGDYFFSRVRQHGQRRAEEMREAAATMREAGLEPLMAAAIAHAPAVDGRPRRNGHIRRAAAGCRVERTGRPHSARR